MVTKSSIFKPKILGGFAQRGRRGRNKPPRRQKPPLTIKQILSWADAHYERTGQWPQARLRQLYDVPTETWIGVNSALSLGYRGLPGGSSLAKLLAEWRGVRNGRALPHLSMKQILAWADAHYKRTGRWPKVTSGQINDAPFETWGGVAIALRSGYRGLSGGNSLPRLLAERRDVRNSRKLPRLSIKLILAWADAYYAQNGKWPHSARGRIEGAPLSETWASVDTALRSGSRGLTGSISLARFLVKHRGMRSQIALPKLTVKQVLAWADAHHERTGKWPHLESGHVIDQPSETWGAINSALYLGYRGFRGGCTLAQFLMRRRGIRSRRALPQLKVRKILAWADAYHKRAGRWPTFASGPVEGSGGETWLIIERALHSGSRGLPGGYSLSRFLNYYRQVPHRLIRPKLTIDTILNWADAHYQRTGQLPKCKSGTILETQGETWASIEYALRVGNRGLPKRRSLFLLLAKYRGVRGGSGPTAR